MLSYNSPVSAQPSTTNTIPNMPLGTNPKPIPVSAGPVTSNNTIAKAAGVPSPKYHHIWLVTGPAGCGKTTVAKHLSEKMNVPYIEGDDVGSIFVLSATALCYLPPLPRTHRPATGKRDTYTRQKEFR